MALTAARKRQLLEDAWDASGKGDDRRSLRDELRYREKQIMAVIQGGSPDQVSANGRTHRFAFQGVGQNTPVEIAEAYRELIDLYDDSKRFLKFCAQWGLSAFTAFLEGVTTPDQATIWQQFFENAGNPNGVVEAGNLASQCYDTVNKIIWLRDAGQGRGNQGWR